MVRSTIALISLSLLLGSVNADDAAKFCEHCEKVGDVLFKVEKISPDNSTVQLSTYIPANVSIARIKGQPESNLTVGQSMPCSIHRVVQAFSDGKTLLHVERSYYHCGNAWFEGRSVIWPGSK